MFLKNSIEYIIMIFVLIISGIFLNYVKSYNIQLQNTIDEKKDIQNNYKKKIDNILKGKNINNLNESFKKLKQYFGERKNLTKLELFIFLEFVYPKDNFATSITIKENNIQLSFYTDSLEDIRKLNTNLLFLKNKEIISTYKLSEISKKHKIIFKNGEKIINKYYSLTFKLNPNYDLIREFILKRNARLKIPFTKYYILLQKDINNIIEKDKEKEKDKNKK